MKTDDPDALQETQVIEVLHRLYYPKK